MLGPSSIKREVTIGVILTALYFLARGYMFGAMDQSVNLPYILREADSEFLPGDLLLDISNNHPSFYYKCFAWLSQFVSLEMLFFGAHVLSIFSMILGLRALAHSLWEGPSGEWAAAIGVAGAFFLRYVAGNIPNFDEVFLPRVASMGLLLYAMSLGVRNRHLWAFALTGVVFLFHATTASHTAVLLWCACAFGGRRNFQYCLLGPLAFLGTASPLLLLMALNVESGIPVPAPYDWVQSLKLNFPFHHFPDLWEFSMKAGPTLLAIYLGIAVSPWGKAGHILTGYVVGGLLLFLAGGIGNWLFNWPVTIHLHVFEVGRILDSLAILSLGRWSFFSLGRPVFLQLASALVVGAFFIRSSLFEWVSFRWALDMYLLALALGTTLFYRYLRSNQPRILLGSLRGNALNDFPRSSILIFSVIGLGLLLATNPIPDWKTTGEAHKGYTMMRWAREVLPHDAVVIIPPYMNEPLCAFRYFARRRAIGCWKDGGEGTFDYAYQLHWERQLRDLTGMGEAIIVPDGSVTWKEWFSWLQTANMTYQSMPTRHFLIMAQKYGATHVVREADSPNLSIPLVYTDQDYDVYQLSNAENLQDNLKSFPNEILPPHQAPS